MSGSRTMLSLAEHYLAERRRLGFKLDRAGSQILSFARFADRIGHQGPMTAALVLQWARDEAHRASPFTWGQRVDVLRPFARDLTGLEPETTFPEGAPFGRCRRRLTPHIYTPEEIAALIRAARRVPSRSRLRPATYATLFGLLAATGLRISEGLRLTCGDLDIARNQLTVRQAKFQRSRLVPLHSTTVAALRTYLAAHAKHASTDAGAPLFPDGDTAALKYSAVRWTFGKLITQLGIVARGGHERVRIHDLRHTFICRQVMRWHESGAEIDNAMMALSTYVGHVSPSDTYWYLHAVPDLMAIAGGRFEAFAAKAGEAHDG